MRISVQKLINLVKIGRYQMSPVTMSAAVLGALTINITDPKILLGLCLIGFCAHMFGFVLNDIFDRKLDQTVNYRSMSPLLRNQVTEKEALLFVVVQVPISFLIYFVLLGGTVWGAIILLLSIVLSVFYNAWSKWGKIPKIIPEAALACSVGMLALSGALVESPVLPRASLLYCLAMTLGLLLLNAVPSGLKDLKADQQFGANSFVIWTGAAIKDNDKLVIPSMLRVFSFSLQLIFMTLIVVLSVLFETNWMISAVAVIFSVYGILHLRMVLWSNSYTKLRSSQILLSGVYNYLALTILLYSSMPVVMKIFILGITLGALWVPLSRAIRILRNKYIYTENQFEIQNKRTSGSEI